LNEVSTQYDLVILDCPPSIKLSNIQVISTLVDGMFIVYAMNQTKKEALAFTAQALLQVSAPLCGLIANHVVPHTLDQYGYYDHISRYHDGPGDTTHAVEDKSAVREDGLSDSKRKNKHQQQ
ncbi:MAG TPA: hypothetical protein VHV83_17830, partial [Armatimonadota bacterium]|nr:hypothetical protein [Armatimonadota bacterium]